MVCVVVPKGYQVPPVPPGKPSGAWLVSAVKTKRGGCDVCGKRVLGLAVFADAAAMST